MKKRLISIIIAVITVLGMFLAGCNGCKGCAKNKGTGIIYKSVAEAVENQAHEEIAGYKFCGYFENANFTKRVMEGFDEIPEDLYAKYQPDRTQLFSYSSTYKRPEIYLTETIYAKNYLDAVTKYKHYLQHKEFLSIAAGGYNAKLLGNGLTEIEVRMDDGSANKKFVFEDDSDEWVWRVNNENGMMQINVPRNFKWNGYVGSVAGSVDGFEYIKVNNKFAVIIGVEESEQELEYNSYTFPSKIEGLPVKEISIELGYGREVDINELTVPSSVENFFMLKTNVDSEIDKIVFEEGVKTIRLISGQTEDLVIPSTAYYVDLLWTNFGAAVPEEYSYAGDQQITVNGGEHYYTENGFLISKEGDLVHQFAGRGNLNVEIPNGVKRVLRRSVKAGITKNFTIPASVEYFDPFFNEFSIRYNANIDSNSRLCGAGVLLFVQGKNTAKSILENYVKKDLLVANDIKHQFYTVVFDEKIQWQNIIDSMNKKLTTEEIAEVKHHFNNLPLTIQEDYVFFKVFDILEGEYIDSWKIVSCLNNDYDISMLNDGALVNYINYER